MPSTYVALLRGINVGGKNRLPMKDLARVFLDVGCAEARTYVQSGNVVFEADVALAERVPQAVAAEVSARFGLRTPVVLRAAEQMREVVAGNPFLAAGAPEDALHVLFLADEPAPDRIASLDPARSTPDAFRVRGRDVYLWLPGGVARTRLTNDYFDSKLATTSTGRNWRTVCRILELMEGGTVR